ncbi:MAG: hypothetical protein JST19_14900 [Bacteroidetes bacterium]|nr:hypothetical protein [Bacteroidota bacterium]
MTMKMPSTYISLVLLCGGLAFYIYTHRSIAKSGPASPAVKEIRPVVKRILPAGLPVVPLNKNYNNEKELLQARLTKTGFSFFRDVICHVVPALKTVK